MKAIINTDDDGNGVLKMFNKIGSTVISGASIRTSNSAGKEMLFMGSEYAGYGGGVTIKNSEGKDIAYIGIHTQLKSAMIATRNSEGNIETYIGPSVTLPNVLAIKKLNANGTIPTNARASPVWSEFCTRRLLSVDWVELLTFSSVKI